VSREVAVASADGPGLTVITGTAAVSGDVMRLNLSGRASSATLRVRVAWSRPVAYRGAVKHAWQLDLLRGSVRTPAPQRRCARRDAAQLRSILGAPDLMGVLTRDVGVRMLNASPSGCLLETVGAIPSGTVARLRMRIEQSGFGDDVRVTRCRRVEGAGATHRMAVEFLWTTQAGTRSLRRKLRTLAALPSEIAGDHQRAVSIHGFQSDGMTWPAAQRSG